MQFSPTRFVTITGTEVLATPNSNAEAKIALKELRQKKKEYALRRRALLGQQKQARDAADKALGGSSPRRKKSGLLSTLGMLVGRAKARKPKRDLVEIDADLAETDEILFNIDSCAIQIEGRLLNLS
jgi:hypothetical protein